MVRSDVDSDRWCSRSASLVRPVGQVEVTMFPSATPSRLVGGVHVRLPADPAQLFVLRSLAASMAIRQDFDLDAVADVKLAVDEMCSGIAVRARPGEPLVCDFLARDGVIDVTVTTVSTIDEPIAQDTFGWLVLQTLSDSVSSWTEPDVTGGYRIRARLCVGRPGAPG
jgi:serine/threonine-protein kinase RsbW